jgi:hypothetical protein
MAWNAEGSSLDVTGSNPDPGNKIIEKLNKTGFLTL